MVATCRLGKGLLALGIGLAIGGLLGEESWGQPGGGFDGDGGGGMGGGRGRGGRGSLRPRPRGPFGDMHWEAQLLLRENREVLRYLPPPVRVYMFTALKDWDNLFLPERKRVRVFFRKAVLDGPEGVTKAFQKVLPPAAPQGSQGGRGGRMAWQAFAQPHLLARVADALDRYVQDEMAFAPALVIIAITGDKAPSDSAAFPDSLAAQGTLLKHVRFDVEPRRWLAALLAGREDGLKGRKLAYPSIFEYHNRGWEDKTHARTLAFAIDDKQFPAPSSAKGYGKKYGPGLVRASDFEYAAQFIRDRLGGAQAAGRAKHHVEVVKALMTPQKLRVDKAVKERAMTRQVTRALLASDENRDLGNAFLHHLSLQCLPRAQPDLFLLQLQAGGDPEDERILLDVWNLLRTHYRYAGRTTLAVLHQPAGEVLLAGHAVPAARVVQDAQSMPDLSATLCQLAGIRATVSRGSPLRLLAAQ